MEDIICTFNREVNNIYSLERYALPVYMDETYSVLEPFQIYG